jgi:hypothetical protein
VLAAVATILLALGGPITARPANAALSASPSPSSASSTTDDWSELHPAIAPLPRDSAVAAYDATTQAVVVSGGESSCGGSDREVYQDTWTWSGSGWTEASTTAPAVFGVPNAYDDATGTVDVIWVPSCGSLVTSQWNGQAWTSTFAEPAASSDQPAPDPDGAMAYDPSNQSLVLWSPSAGHQPAAASPPPDQSSTWGWAGRTWQQASLVTSPPASIGAATEDVQMVYDSATGRVFLYGDPSRTMWAWDGNDWSEVSTSGGPSPRVGASMVYDAALRQVLLFGGVSVTGYAPASGDQSESFVEGAPLSDLWTWNGSTWKELHPAHSPPARFRAQMAYDAESGQVILFGGSVNNNADVADTWVYGPTS